ncbi:MAG: ISNCY family transposase [Lamprobacter sp.]|uniref:ISNCY family transposase n=1 Tax=Lamprobacter sp. TaxID=3100796 RepID=UPI002B256768|nr:ISNCY family transposase [Lamprobacter sp.]MEA3643895.1 ISNCY family transposase [Lamprobacter sp.]
MRETRNAQASIFDRYSEHEFGRHLERLSALLDEYPQVLELIAGDFNKASVARTGACGLSVESILRCLVLKQITQLSYQKLSFHLSDSATYRTFARLTAKQSPSKSALQATIRRVQPETLVQIHRLLISDWLVQGQLSLDTLRIDSTVVDSNIAPPSDSGLLEDGIRVLSRLMANSKINTGVKIRFVDQRKRSKSLAFRIFHAKKPEKNRLYPELIRCARVALEQTSKAIDKVRLHAADEIRCRPWIDEVEHYRGLLIKVIDQTERRVIHNEKVPASEKIVSLFEPHTDIIVKGLRDVQYGHKVNLATERYGFVTYFKVEDGNPADSTLYQPVLDACQSDYEITSDAVVTDAGYAGADNVRRARQGGVKRAVFNKPLGLSLHDMGVKRKTFVALRDFRAGIEGNISELKRAFGMSRATWKGLSGFGAYVWSAVLSYNLMRCARLCPG